MPDQSTAPRPTPAARGDDLLTLALSALRQQKVRTALSVLGVVIGTCSLALSLSIGKGVQVAFVKRLRENEQLRRVYLTPIHDEDATVVPAESLALEGTMSDARRARLKRSIVTRWNRTHLAGAGGLLNEKGLTSLARMPHVVGVIPLINENGRATLDGKSVPASLSTADVAEFGLKARSIVGGLPASPTEHGVVIHEYLAYAWGITNEADVAKLIGRKVRVEFTARRSPQATTDRNAPDSLGVVGDDFVITGIIRQRMRDDPPAPMSGNWGARDGEVLIPYAAAQEFFFRSQRIADRGAAGAIVVVDSETNVGAVDEQLRKNGYTAFSLISVIEQFQRNARYITFALALIAAIAMLVSAIGIMNTMIMAVLERTREIGVMKAVGARDRYIHVIFLIEGAVIGLVGGFGGVLLSWLAHFPGDAIARVISLRQTNTVPSESIFAYPLAIVLGVPALACLIAMLAAILPARRAARVDPVTALRHE